MSEPITVLIVDDSPLFQDAMRSVIGEDPELCVVGVAADGREAVRLARQLCPTVITMDVHMPVMNGLDAIQAIMDQAPSRILVLTGDPQAEKGALCFEALRRGALDVMLKPALGISSSQGEELRERLKILSTIVPIRHVAPREPVEEISYNTAPSPDPSQRVIAIVASTGGPVALMQILEKLPVDYPTPIVIVQHIAAGFCAAFAQWLDDSVPLKVSVANHGEHLRPGRALIAPTDHHLVIVPHRRVALDGAPPLEGHRPSGTLLLRSAAEVSGRSAIGVILTGMGRDGVEGLKSIRAVGGLTLAQDERSCSVYGMPKAALESGAVRYQLSPTEIARTLLELAGRCAQ